MTPKWFKCLSCGQIGLIDCPAMPDGCVVLCPCGGEVREIPAVEAEEMGYNPPDEPLIVGAKP